MPKFNKCWVSMTLQAYYLHAANAYGNAYWSERNILPTESK